VLCLMRLLVAIAGFQIPGPDVGAPAEPRVWPPDVSIQSIAPDRISEALRQDAYTAVPLPVLLQLLRSVPKTSAPESVVTRPAVSRAVYSARLVDMTRLSGRLHFEVDEDTIAENDGAMSLGGTSLLDLLFANGDRSLLPGNDSHNQLFLLVDQGIEHVTGTWSATGSSNGKSTVFRLDLPRASIAQMELATPADVVVTSGNALVLGPERITNATGDASVPPGATELGWRLFPNSATRMTIACRRRDSTGLPVPLIVNGFSAAHVINGDTLESRWSFSVPSFGSEALLISCRVPSRTRVTEVRINDSASTEWTVRQDAASQVLTVRIPRWTNASSVSLSAVSVLRDLDSVEIPFLTPTHWRSGNQAGPAAVGAAVLTGEPEDAPGSEQSNQQPDGPLMFALSTFTLAIPAGMNLEHWELMGVQERDVSVNSDGKRLFQMTRIAPSAKAVARIAVTAPRITDSVLVISSASDRTSTVTCMVHVHCEDAAAVQLDWPVARGWRPVSARYASNSQALYFEHLSAPISQTASLLVVHLPEALEPGAHRILEFEFQVTQGQPGRLADIPILSNPRYARETSGLAADSNNASALTLFRDRDRDTQVVSRAELLEAMPWLPKFAVPPNAVTMIRKSQTLIDTDTSATATHEGADSATQLDAQPVEISAAYAATLNGDTLTETTTLMIPTDATDTLSASLILKTAECDVESLTCRIDNFVCTLVPVDVPDDDKWNYWRVAGIPASDDSAESTIEITCSREARDGMPAVIAYPAFDSTVSGTGSLTSSTGRRLAADDTVVTLSTETAVSNRTQQNTQTIQTFDLPVVQRHLRLFITDPSLNSHPQSVRQQIRHLIRLSDGTLRHDALARIDVSGNERPARLPLTMAAEDIVCVCVNNRAVRALRDSGGTYIPIPTTGSPAIVRILWKQPVQYQSIADISAGLRSVVDLVEVGTVSHVLLVDPQLSPAREGFQQRNEVVFSSAAQIQDDFVSSSSSAEALPQPIQTFLGEWRLFSSDAWQQMGLVQSGPSSEIQLSFSSRYVLRSVCLASAVLAVAFTLLLIRTGKFRSFACLFLAASLVTLRLSATAIVQSVASGCFWGIALTLFWHLCRRPRPVATGGIGLQLGQTVLMIMTLVPAAHAQPPDTPTTTTPDIVLPTESIDGVPVAYVRQPLLQKWQSGKAAGSTSSPPFLTTASRIVIYANSLTDVEARLTMDVTARADVHEQLMQLALDDASLVSCEVNGQPVLPVSVSAVASQSTIAIPLISSLAVTPRILAALPKQSSVSSPAQSAVAGQRQWQTHHVSLLLRPAVTRSHSGTSFHLPAPDCPQRTVRLSANTAEIASALIESAGQFTSWTPDTTGDLQIAAGYGSNTLSITLRPSASDVTAIPTQIKSAIISECQSGQHVITMLLKMPNADSVSAGLTLVTPDGYRVASVNASPATEVLWTVDRNRVLIQNPAASLSGRLVAVQFLSSHRADPHQQSIAVQEILGSNAYAVTDPLVMAVRTAPEFIVQTVEADGAPVDGKAGIPSEFASLIRRTDVLFELPADVKQSVIRQATRVAVSEARVQQQVILADTTSDMSVSADIETSVHFVFRHRVRLAPDITVLDVTVTAGEANRLQSWTRHGDLLVVQLKQATSGLHNLTIKGRIATPPPGHPLRIRPPIWEDIQVLESDLTLADHSTHGYIINELGAAVPEELMESGTRLPTATPVRLQVVGESEPIILKQLPPSAGDDSGVPALPVDSESRESTSNTGQTDPELTTTANQPQDNSVSSSGAKLTRQNHNQAQSVSHGKCVVMSLIHTGGSGNPGGSSLIIAHPTNTQHSFNVRIPESMRITGMTASPGVKWTLNGNSLLIRSDDVVAELTLRWVSARGNPNWARMDVDLPLPVVTDLQSRYFVSVADAAPENDPNATLVTFSSDTPSLSPIEMQSQLRLGLADTLAAVTTASGTTADDGAQVARIMTSIDETQEAFLSRLGPEPYVLEEMLHFKLNTTSRFRATAIRIPGMYQLLPFVVAIGLIGMTSVAEARRRRADRMHESNLPDSIAETAQLPGLSKTAGPLGDVFHNSPQGDSSVNTGTDLESEDTTSDTVVPGPGIGPNPNS
jgi:hypothetical protein